MRIVVDLDGVLYEWSKTARYLLRTQKGYIFETKEAQEWNWHIAEGVSEEDWNWLWTTGVTLGLFRYGHVVRGAIEGIRGLHGLGHELVVCTHRPTSAVRDTIDWLSYLNLPFSGIHILSRDEPKTVVEGDLLIDDKIENVIEWADSGRRAIIFDRPWNREMGYHHGVIRAYGWPDVLNVVASIIKTQIQYGQYAGV